MAKPRTGSPLMSRKWKVGDRVESVANGKPTGCFGTVVRIPKEGRSQVHFFVTIRWDEPKFGAVESKVSPAALIEATDVERRENPTRKPERGFVYWNLHKDLYSVRVTGKPVTAATAVRVRDADLVVQPGGRKRVLETKQKSVHAGVRGEVEIADDFKIPGKGWVRVRYDPYKFASFVRVDNEEPVLESPEVIMVIREGRPRVYAKESAAAKANNPGSKYILILERELSNGDGIEIQVDADFAPGSRGGWDDPPEGGLALVRSAFDRETKAPVRLTDEEFDRVTEALEIQYEEELQDREGAERYASNPTVAGWKLVKRTMGKIQVRGRGVSDASATGPIFEEWKRGKYRLTITRDQYRGVDVVDVEVRGPYGDSGVYGQWATDVGVIRPRAMAFANRYMDMGPSDQATGAEDPQWIWEQVTTTTMNPARVKRMMNPRGY